MEARLGYLVKIWGRQRDLKQSLEVSEGARQKSSLELERLRRKLT
jgi:hypothetical protein